MPSASACRNCINCAGGSGEAPILRIAEEDLEIRGPGEFLGTRQAGMPDFHVANLARDIDILGQARKAAFELVAKDPSISAPEHQNFRKILLSRWKGKLELVEVA